MITYPIIRMTVGGVAEEFSGEEVISASLVREIDPLSIELPASEVEFTIYTTDEKWSIFSDGTYFNSLSRKQPVDVYEDIDGTEVFLGHFYLDDWKRLNDSQFWFKGICILGILDQVDYDGQFWVDDTPLYQIIDTIFEGLGISYKVLSPVNNVLLRGWVPPGTVREALQQACFAGGATVDSSREELIIQECKLPINDSSSPILITDAQKKSSEELELLKLVTGIEVVSHDYSQDDELVTIFDKYLAEGAYKIVFEEPYYGVVTTGVGYSVVNLTTEDGENLTTEDGDELVIPSEFIYGPNSLYLSVDSPGGQVLVQGYRWIDSQQAHLFHESVDGAVKENRLKIDQATLVSPERGDAVLANLADYHRQRYSQRLTLLTGAVFPTRFYGEAPEYGDGLYEEDPSVKINELADATTYGTRSIHGLIERIDIDLTGGCLKEIELIGVEA